MKKTKKKAVVLEHNAMAPIFGDSTGGRCYPVTERIQTKLRRLYSTETEEWQSFEHQRPDYIRAEMTYQHKCYVGIGHDDSAAWQDLRRQLPPVEDSIEVDFVGCARWWIMYVYTPWGNWCCEGTVLLVLLEKLLARVKRGMSSPGRGQDVGDDSDDIGRG